MPEAALIDPQPTSAFWHALPADEVIARLRTDPAEGLDAAEASRRLASFGPDHLPDGKLRGPRGSLRSSMFSSTCCLPLVM